MPDHDDILFTENQSDAASSDEEYRLSVLSGLQLLDTAPEASFDSIVALAQQLTGCPIALISLLDAERQWFKARCGLAVSQTPREQAFCDHAIAQDGVMVVEDATRDSRFSDNPLVVAGPAIRFYAGIPLLVSGGPGLPDAAIGTLCVIDVQPRCLSAPEQAALSQLATITVALIQSRRLTTAALEHAQANERAASVLAQERRKFRQAERMADIGSWRLDLTNESLHWSEQVYAIYGLPLGQKPALGDALSFYPPTARAQLSAALARTMETGEAYDIETDFIAATGAMRRVRSMGELEIVNGVPTALFGVFQEVTKRYEMEQALRHSASNDSLTGIANRASFDEALEARIAHAIAHGQRLALMLVDLDGFKKVNDAQGHLAGDELLQAIASRLRDGAYADCFVARLGGDEFGLILPGTPDRAALEHWALKVMDDLCRPIDTVECKATISGSIGIACLNEAGDTRRELMRRADMALYEAKHAGRGCARIEGIAHTIAPPVGDTKQRVA